MKFKLLFILVLCCSIAGAQEYSNLKKKRVAVRDSIMVDSVSINPFYFKIQDKIGMPIDSTQYRVDYSKALLILNSQTNIVTDSIDVTYLPLPDFLTKTYKQYDTNIILDNTDAYSIVDLFHT